MFSEIGQCLESESWDKSVSEMTRLCLGLPEILGSILDSGISFCLSCFRPQISSVQAKKWLARGGDLPTYSTEVTACSCVSFSPYVFI
jgi:hypothetical protein